MKKPTSKRKGTAARRPKGSRAAARKPGKPDFAQRTADVLRLSQEGFFEMFMAAPAGISVSDPSDGTLVEVNEEFARIFGRDRADMIGQTTLELGMWADTADRTRLLAEVMANGSAHEIELAMLTASGERLLLRTSFRLMKDHGHPLVLAAFVDITARRQVERALHLSEQKFGTIFRASPIALAVSVYETGCFTEVNPALLRLMGAASFDEMVGKTSVEIGMVTPDVRRTKIIEPLRSGRNAGLPVPMHKLDGTPFSAELSLSSFEADGTTYLLTSIVDVSARLRAQDERYRAEQQYRELVEGVRDVVFSMTPDGIITSLNPAFERLTGMAAADWIGKPFFSLLHDDDVARAAEEFRAAMRNEHPANPPLRIRTASGSYRFGEIQATPRMQNGNVVSVLGIGRDVSERVELEDQFRQAQKMEAVGRLAGGVAHDFNNLLTVIISTGDLVLQELARDDPHRADVEEIEKAALRAAELTRQLLAFSRRQVLEVRTLDLNLVIANIEKLLRRLIGEDVTLLTIPARKLGSVKADPGQVEQVIVNLAVNARDAMPKGGSLTIFTEDVALDPAFVRDHPGTEPGPFVRLSVSDTGCGMTDEVRSHIFEPFYTTKESGKGTGLGLSTVYGIVKQSGGCIDVTSVAGRGTTFDIYLPRVAADDDARRDAPNGHQRSLKGGETILVAEDNAALRDLIVKVLHGYGYATLAAEDGQSALDMAAQHSGQIDLLLSDVVMPGMSGPTLAARMKAADAGIKVLYLSGYTDDAISSQDVSIGAVALLQKPFTPAALARRVREALDAVQHGQ